MSSKRERLLEADYPDANPKQLAGMKKVPTSVLSEPVLMEMGLGMLEGACKYGRHNYRKSKIKHSVYYDALRRHLAQWWEGEDIDEESGLHHVTKMLTTLAVLRDAMIFGMDEDDRPPKAPDGWLTELNKKAQEIMDKYPDPMPPFTEKD